MPSKRIDFISSLVSTNIVYDMCCDHGQIGELSLVKGREVLFIDIVSSITEKLQSRLLKKYSNFEVITQSILYIESFKNHSTIILAGIGSNLLSQFLDKYSSIFNDTHQIIICAHSNQHIAIGSMNTNKLTRLSEFIIEDSSRFYEVYVCQKQKDFKENFNINKDFSKIKSSNYHKEQLKFLSFKKDNEIAKTLYQQLLQI